MSKRTNKFSPEVRARAVRMVLDHEGEHPSRWQAVQSIAAKIGCSAYTEPAGVNKTVTRRGKFDTSLLKLITSLKKIVTYSHNFITRLRKTWVFGVNKSVTNNDNSVTF